MATTFLLRLIFTHTQKEGGGEESNIKSLSRTLPKKKNTTQKIQSAAASVCCYVASKSGSQKWILDSNL